MNADNFVMDPVYKGIQYIFLHFSTFLIISVFFLINVNADKRVISGDFEYGERYTDNYESPEEVNLSQEDEEFDKYSYKNYWLQYDHPLKKNVKVTARIQKIDRDFSERNYLNNNTNYGQIRLTIEPAEGWALWPHISLRNRDYVKNELDNDIILAGCEARYRWGIRHNVRFGGAYTSTDYLFDSAKDRQSGSTFASYERPISEGLTLRIRTRAEQTSFKIQSATRENSLSFSASVGFRYEF